MDYVRSKWFSLEIVFEKLGLIFNLTFMYSVVFGYRYVFLQPQRKYQQVESVFLTPLLSYKC